MHIRHQREGRTSQPLASKNRNTEMAGRSWPGGTGLWRGERPDRTRPHESAHRVRSRIEHTGGIIVACDSRAHLKAWSNRPSWKISLHTKTNPTSPLVGLPEGQKLGCRLGTSPRAGSKTSKSTGKLGSFVFLCFCVHKHKHKHKHKHTQTEPYFCAGRSEKRQVPRTSPRVDDTNTQKHTQTHRTSEIPPTCIGRTREIGL